MLHSIAVRDYMEASLVTFTPDMDIMQATHMLITKRISGAPVVDEHGNLVGILSEKDCLRVALSASFNETYGGRVDEFMSRDVRSIDADMSVLELVELFLSTPYRRFPVVDDNRLVGEITRLDLLRALEKLW